MAGEVEGEILIVLQTVFPSPAVGFVPLHCCQGFRGCIAPSLRRGCCFWETSRSQLGVLGPFCSLCSSDLACIFLAAVTFPRFPRQECGRETGPNESNPPTVGSHRRGGARNWQHRILRPPLCCIDCCFCCCQRLMSFTFSKRVGCSGSMPL